MQQEVGIRLKVAAQGLEHIQSLIKELDAAGVNTTELKAKADTLGTSLGKLSQTAAQAGEGQTGLGGAAAVTAKAFAGLYAEIKSAEVILRQLVTAVVDLDRLRRTLTVVTGSGTEAARQIEFLRSAAMRTGQDFSALAGEYGKFVASAAQANVPMAVVQKTFEGVSASAGVLGLSADRVSVILNALGQMASKGTVQMEELRGQLGDSLPGALSLMAKGLNLTDAELIKLVESGGLMARDALPALGDALTRFAAKGGSEVSGLTAEWNRFKNVILEAGTLLAEGPIGRTVGTIFVAFAGVLRDISFAAVGANEALRVIGRTVALLGAAVTGQIGSWRQFKDEFDQIMIDSGANITRFRDRAYTAGEAAKSAGTSAAAAAPQFSTLGQSISAAGQQAQAGAPAIAAAATATAAAGEAAGGASTKWYSIKVAYDQVLDSVAKQVQISTELAKAKDAEGAATVASAKLIGDERIAREAQAKAAEESARAYDEEARAQKTRADVLEAERNALLEVSRVEGNLNDDRKKHIAEIEDLIAKQRAIAESAKQVSEAHRETALAARQVADTYGDQSLRVVQYRGELKAAQLQLESVRIEMRYGRATTDDLRIATDTYNAALGRLRGAIFGAQSALDAWIKTKQADTNVATARLKVQLEEQKTIEQIAEMHGNQVQAEQARIRQMEIELEIRRLSVKAKKDEGDETIRVLQLEKDEAAAIGLLTPEKEREISLRIRNAEAAKLEVAAEEQRIKVAEAKLQRSRITDTSNNDSVNKRPKDLGNQKRGTTQQVVNGRLVEVGPDGTYAGISGISNEWSSSVPSNPPLPQGPVDNSYVFGLRDRYRSGDTFSANERPAIENALRVARDNARIVGSSTPQSVSGLRDAEGWVTLLQSILERTPYSSSSAAPTAARVVTINIGSSSANVAVASDADAAALERILRQLETSARVAQPGG